MREPCCEHADEHNTHEQAPAVPKCLRCPARKAVHLLRRGS